MTDMKKRFYGWAAAAVVLLVSGSCNGGGSTESETFANIRDVYEVKGVKFEMNELPGGTFDMGTRPNGQMISGSAGINQVVLDGFAVSSAPVSQELWKAVMGSNPGSAADAAAPVDRVSFKDAEKFVVKLRRQTGVPFVLPTEAMWEYAVRETAFVPVKGLTEWCSDRFSDRSETPQLRFNPGGPEEGALRVARQAYERKGVQPDSKAAGLGFRVAVRTGKPCPETVVKAVTGEAPQREHVCADETFTVGGVSFQMIGVAGGTFRMGATDEQAQYGEDNEKPVHEVTVEPFGIGRTEVTAGLWQAVMGTLPLGNSEKEPERPVVNVSWYGAQMFILKLNELTGRTFRLPTESEWEYAARGGNRSRHHRFSGSDSVGSVAAYTKNTDKGRPVKVMSFQGNELGLYDMSGNVWEWCQDAYADYGGEPDAGEWKVMRGGSAASPWNACRVSNRTRIPASNVKGTFGFRLAL